jgi:D-arabinose 1-dehydrogenase-like Zn-dependent alcohol dehydrogenase
MPRGIARQGKRHSSQISPPIETGRPALIRPPQVIRRTRPGRRRFSSYSATARLDQARGRFDLILDTIPGPHDRPPLLRLLGLDGTLSLIGFPAEFPVRIMDLTYGPKKLTSSGTGGRPGTARLLAFCAGPGIAADVEVLPSGRVQEALTRLGQGDVRYRFVLDLSDLG